MSELRRFELEDLANRPGTYVNPHTDIVIVVDDTATVDHELLGAEEEGWVLVSDETPLDEAARDDLLEGLQRRASRARPPAAAFEDAETLDLEDGDAEDEEDFGRAGFDDPRTRDDDGDWD